MTLLLRGALLASALMLALIPGMAWARATSLTVRSGQVISVPGTSVVARVVAVYDFSSQGCEGGPQGCPDRVELNVTNGKSRVTLILFQPHTEYQRQQATNRKSAFGVDFILVGIHVATATLRTVTAK